MRCDEMRCDALGRSWLIRQTGSCLDERTVRTGFEAKMGGVFSVVSEKKKKKTEGRSRRRSVIIMNAGALMLDYGDDDCVRATGQGRMGPDCACPICTNPGGVGATIMPQTASAVRGRLDVFGMLRNLPVWRGHFILFGWLPLATPRDRYDTVQYRRASAQGAWPA